MTREAARELLMQLIFQMGVQKDFSDELKNRFLRDYKINAKQKKYIDDMHRAIADNLEEIDALINKSSDGWSTERMAKSDLAICRVALGEILFAEDIPEAVSLNEAVNLAKKFGTDNSQKFVNGLLGKALRFKNEN